MPRRPLSRAASKALLIVALVNMSACHAWEPSVLPSTAPTAVTQLPKARITLKRGGMLQLRDVVIRSDSLVGWSSEQRTAYAIGDVQRIDHQELSLIRSALLGSVIAVVGVATLETLALASFHY
jgi:hypothetical protein